MRKFFFFDIDNTLSVGRPGEQYIPESAVEAIKILEEKGHFIAIATGRAHAMAKGVMEKLNMKNMVSDGGNSITVNEECLYIEPIDKELCIKLFKECDEKGFAWGVSPEDADFRYTKNSDFYDYTKDIYIRTIIKEDLDPSSLPVIYKAYVACKYPEEFKIETLNELPWCRYHDEYLFVEPTDKSKGIKKIVEYFNGDLKDVVVFGDGRNDLSMFRKEWTSIAMGNACDELKEKADYITSDAADDGIYNACKHFGWI